MKKILNDDAEIIKNGINMKVRCCEKYLSDIMAQKYAAW